MTRLLEALEVERVVEVDDHGRVDVAQAGRLPQRIALHDDDVGAGRDADELMRFDVTRPDVANDGMAAVRRDEVDGVRGCQRPGHVHGSDRRTRHLRAQHLAGDDDDAA